MQPKQPRRPKQTIQGMAPAVPMNPMQKQAQLRDQAEVHSLFDPFFNNAYYAKNNDRFGALGTIFSPVIGVGELIKKNTLDYFTNPSQALNSTLRLLGDSMDQMFGSAVIKSIWKGLQDGDDVLENVLRAYGIHDNGRTQYDASDITGSNNFFLNMGLELLVDPSTYFGAGAAISMSSMVKNVDDVGTVAVKNISKDMFGAINKLDLAKQTKGFEKRITKQLLQGNKDDFFKTLKAHDTAQVLGTKELTKYWDDAIGTGAFKQSNNYYKTLHELDEFDNMFAKIALHPTLPYMTYKVIKIGNLDKLGTKQIKKIALNHRIERIKKYMAIGESEYQTILKEHNITDLHTEIAKQKQLLLSGVQDSATQVETYKLINDLEFKYKLLLDRGNYTPNLEEYYTLMKRLTMYAKHKSLRNDTETIVNGATKVTRDSEITKLLTDIQQLVEGDEHLRVVFISNNKNSEILKELKDYVSEDIFNYYNKTISQMEEQMAILKQHSPNSAIRLNERLDEIEKQISEKKVYKTEGELKKLQGEKMRIKDQFNNPEIKPEVKKALLKRLENIEDSFIIQDRATKELDKLKKEKAEILELLSNKVGEGIYISYDEAIEQSRNIVKQLREIAEERRLYQKAKEELKTLQKEQKVLQTNRAAMGPKSNAHLSQIYEEIQVREAIVRGNSDKIYIDKIKALESELNRLNVKMGNMTIKDKGEIPKIRIDSSNEYDNLSKHHMETKNVQELFTGNYESSLPSGAFIKADILEENVKGYNSIQEAMVDAITEIFTMKNGEMDFTKGMDITEEIQIVSENLSELLNAIQAISPGTATSYRTLNLSAVFTSERYTLKRLQDMYYKYSELRKNLILRHGYDKDLKNFENAVHSFAGEYKKILDDYHRAIINGNDSTEALKIARDQSLRELTERNHDLSMMVADKEVFDANLTTIRQRQEVLKKELNTLQKSRRDTQKRITFLDAEISRYQGFRTKNQSYYENIVSQQDLITARKSDEDAFQYMQSLHALETGNYTEAVTKKIEDFTKEKNLLSDKLDRTRSKYNSNSKKLNQQIEALDEQAYRTRNVWFGKAIPGLNPNMDMETRLEWFTHIATSMKNRDFLLEPNILLNHLSGRLETIKRYAKGNKELIGQFKEDDIEDLIKELGNVRGALSIIQPDLAKNTDVTALNREFEKLERRFKASQENFKELKDIQLKAAFDEIKQGVTTNNEYVSNKLAKTLGIDLIRDSAGNITKESETLVQKTLMRSLYAYLDVLRKSDPGGLFKHKGSKVNFAQLNNELVGNADKIFLLHKSVAPFRVINDPIVDTALDLLENMYLNITKGNLTPAKLDDFNFPAQVDAIQWLIAKRYKDLHIMPEYAGKSSDYIAKKGYDSQFNIFKEVLDDTTGEWFSDHLFHKNLLSDRLSPIIFNSDKHKNLNLRDATYITYDLETTGLNKKDQIIQITASVHRYDEQGNLIKVGESYSHKVKLQENIQLSDEVSKLTKITVEDLINNGVDMDDAIAGFEEYIKVAGGDQAVLVAHNANFDFNFLETARGRIADKYQREFIPMDNPVLDTIGLAFNYGPDDIENYKLQTLAERLGIEVVGDKLHDAEYDAELTSKILGKLLNMTNETDTLEHLNSSNFTTKVFKKNSNEEMQKFLDMINEIQSATNPAHFKKELKATGLENQTDKVKKRTSSYVYDFDKKEDIHKEMGIEGPWVENVKVDEKQVEFGFGQENSSPYFLGQNDVVDNLSWADNILITRIQEINLKVDSHESLARLYTDLESLLSDLESITKKDIYGNYSFDSDFDLLEIKATVEELFNATQKSYNGIQTKMDDYTKLFGKDIPIAHPMMNTTHTKMEVLAHIKQGAEGLRTLRDMLNGIDVELMASPEQLLSEVLRHANVKDTQPIVQLRDLIDNIYGHVDFMESLMQLLGKKKLNNQLGFMFDYIDDLDRVTKKNMASYKNTEDVISSISPIVNKHSANLDPEIVSVIEAKLRYNFEKGIPLMMDPSSIVSNDLHHLMEQNILDTMAVAFAPQKLKNATESVTLQHTEQFKRFRHLANEVLSDIREPLIAASAKNRSLSLSPVKINDFRFVTGMTEKELISKNSLYTLKHAEDVAASQKLKKTTGIMHGDLFEKNLEPEVMSYFYVQNTSLYSMYENIGKYFGGDAEDFAMYGKRFVKDNYNKFIYAEIFDEIIDTIPPELLAKLNKLMYSVESRNYITDMDELVRRIKATYVEMLYSTDNNLNKVIDIGEDGKRIRELDILKGVMSNPLQDYHAAFKYSNPYEKMRKLFPNGEEFLKWFKSQPDQSLVALDSNNKLVKIHMNNINDISELDKIMDTSLLSFMGEDTFIRISKRFQKSSLGPKTKKAHDLLVNLVKFPVFFSSQFIFGNITEAVMKNSIQGSNPYNAAKATVTANKYFSIWSKIKNEAGLNDDMFKELGSSASHRWFNWWFDRSGSVWGDAFKNNDEAEELFRLMKQRGNDVVSIVNPKSETVFKTVIKDIEQLKDLSKRVKPGEAIVINKYSAEEMEIVKFTNFYMLTDASQGEFANFVSAAKKGKVGTSKFDKAPSRKLGEVPSRKQVISYMKGESGHGDPKWFYENFKDRLMYNEMTAKFMNVTQRSEALGRFGLYIDSLNSGKSFNESVDLVRKTYFSLSNKTETELMAEFIIPFAGYPLRNYMFWIEALEKPQAQRVMTDVVLTLWGDQELGSNDYLDYQYLRGKVPLKNNMMDAGLSYMDALALPGTAPQSSERRLNPNIKNIISGFNAMTEGGSPRFFIPGKQQVEGITHAVSALTGQSKRHDEVLPSIFDRYYSQKQFSYHSNQNHYYSNRGFYNDLYTSTGKSRSQLRALPSNGMNLKYKVSDIMWSFR